MRKMIPIFLVALFAIAAVTAQAATINLTNGGLGQRVSDDSTFGFSVCNNGASPVATPVPVQIIANGMTVQAQSSSPIPANGCAFAYVPYSSFGMIGGHNYSVSVTIDPEQTVIANSNNQATYAITMPGAVLGASTTATDQIQLELVSLETQLVQLLKQELQMTSGQ